MARLTFPTANGPHIGIVGEARVFFEKLNSHCKRSPTAAVPLLAAMAVLQAELEAIEQPVEPE